MISAWLPTLIAAVIGGVITGFFALEGVKRQASDARDASIELERRAVRGYLLALKAEIVALHNRFESNMGKGIDGIVSGQPFRMVYPVFQDFFTVYTGNAFLLGRVEDDELRELIVQTYTAGRGIIDSLRYNGALAERLQQLEFQHQAGATPATAQQALAIHYEMVEYARNLKTSASELRDLVKRLVRRIDASAVKIKE